MRETLDPKIARLLAQTNVRVDPRAFIIVGMPHGYETSVRKALGEILAPFFVQIFSSEQTIILAEDEWGRVRAKFPGARQEPGYRLITLDATLDWEVTGYLAAVTRVLADRGVPVGVLSSFHHDHLLVRRDRVDDAIAALQRLIDAARGATEQVSSSGEPSSV